jgi:peptide-methionine (S)-S-oxide reductase
MGGGCFWCTEAVFKLVKGVQHVESGYCNGHKLNPTYEEVCTGMTGHAEVVKVEFDTSVISLENILNIFFATHDPTTLNRQGHDQGTQYRSGIYFERAADGVCAKEVIQKLTEQRVFDAPIVTEVLELNNYYKAEQYHQQYFERNPNQGYCSFVVAPKVAKFRKSFSSFLK